MGSGRISNIEKWIFMLMRSAYTHYILTYYKQTARVINHFEMIMKFCMAFAIPNYSKIWAFIYYDLPGLHYKYTIDQEKSIKALNCL